MAIALEAAEPDDALPIGLPTDDIARRAAVKGIDNALKTDGVFGAYQVMRKEFGTSKTKEFFKSIYGALGKKVEFHHMLPKERIDDFHD